MLRMHVYVMLSLSDYLFITGNVSLPPLAPYMLWLNSSKFLKDLVLLTYSTHPFLGHSFLGQNCAYYMHDFTVVVFMAVLLAGDMHMFLFIVIGAWYSSLLNCQIVTTTSIRSSLNFCCHRFGLVYHGLLKQYSITQPEFVPKLDISLANGELHQGCGHVTQVVL